MLGEGIVSFGVPSVTVSARNVKASPKIVCSSVSFWVTTGFEGVNSIVPLGLRKRDSM